MPLTRYLENES